MNTEVLRVNGDYKIKSTKGDVTIDVTSTSDTGTVYILGNLSVVGNVVAFDTIDYKIKDNIVLLNAGELNNYVTLGTSGIAIARGNSDSLDVAAKILYNDDLYWQVESTSTLNRGVFQLSVENSSTALQVNALRINEAKPQFNSRGVKILSFLGYDNKDSVLSVAGTENYEEQVLDDDDIPNKKYVDSIAYSGTIYAKELESVGTTLRVQDPDATPADSSNRYWNTTPRIAATLGTVTNEIFVLDGTQAQFYEIAIDNNTISTKTADADLVLNTVGTGTVVSNAPLSLLYNSAPLPNAASTIIYTTSTIGGGGSGLYFVNNTNSDELISRKRSLIYSIIF
jgi:hypothetical protein